MNADVSRRLVHRAHEMMELANRADTADRVTCLVPQNTAQNPGEVWRPSD
jgi:hypothetical protein